MNFSSFHFPHASFSKSVLIFPRDHHDLSFTQNLNTMVFDRFFEGPVFDGFFPSLLLCEESASGEQSGGWRWPCDWARVGEKALFLIVFDLFWIVFDGLRSGSYFG